MSTKRKKGGGKGKSQQDKKKEKKEKKIQEEKDDVFLEETKKEFERTQGGRRNWLLLLVVGVSTIVPTYLFQSVVDLHFEGRNLYLFLGIVISFSIYHLYKGASKMYKRNRKSFSTHYAKEVENVSGERVQIEKDRLSELASFGYTLWISNLVFLALVFVGSFYFLLEYDPRVRYSVSMMIGSYVTRVFISRKRSSKKKREKLFP